MNPQPPSPSDARTATVEMTPAEFRALGHELVDRIADFLASIRERPVTPAESAPRLRQRLGQLPLPTTGLANADVMREAVDLLCNHSLLNGHPRFWGYITSSAAPMGALADLLAASVNPNVGAWTLSPIASEIEMQAVQWVAELIGYPVPCGGLFVSGGNMANMVGVWAARRARLPWDVRTQGLRGSARQPLLYASVDTHTWLQKAADLLGFGLDAIRWIPTTSQHQLDVAVLAQRVRDDRAAGALPFLVVGSAGSVGVGAIDPLREMSDFCQREGLWLHVDGAYGAPAAAVPEASPDLRALSRADSVAIDPHKWLYCPLEVGCVLVRDLEHLAATFSFHPDYYHFERGPEEAAINYYELGPQNSRGFRALKVWMILRQVGREGIVRLIRDDIALAQALHAALVAAGPELQTFTQSLSITTFRFVPAGGVPVGEDEEPYLNELNERILTRLQAGGDAFVSNAILGTVYVLRVCIVNFRTTRADVEALPGLVLRLGRAADAELRASRGCASP